MITALLLLGVLSTPGPTVGSPTPVAKVDALPYDPPPGCKDQCTIKFNECYEGGGGWQKCADEQTACYNRCDGLGGSGGGKPGVMQKYE